MNKVRKIFFWHQIFLPASQLASENFKNHNSNQNINNLGTEGNAVDQRTPRTVLKKCYPGKSTLNTFEIFRATLRLVNT